MTPPIETLNAWFWDVLGLGPSKRYRGKYNNMSLKEQAAFRKRKAARVYSKEDRAALTKKGFVKNQMHEGVNLFMVSRKEKGLGTYDARKFVVYQKFDDLRAQNIAELAEMSGTQKKLPRARDKKGRFVSG